MIKIIEYVQESFCSFCNQERTGHLILELKFFGDVVLIHINEKDC